MLQVGSDDCQEVPDTVDQLLGVRSVCVDRVSLVRQSHLATEQNMRQWDQKDYITDDGTAVNAGTENYEL